jgi:ABC-type multidrug transport system ATPase subunit
MITCETLPSQGDILVLGRSVKTHSFAVRRMVGVCKQDDYLWPTLTAKEHLFLFASLNGIEREQEGRIVQEWLESVDLDLVQDQFSRQFSGGMKRRLSLALSTIGGRPLIVLDEPTTGMDPSSRRFVWKHIDFIKKDRVVLLTTHSMEEADLLSDQVAIMKDGLVAARGTSLELKSQYGSALQFNILTETNSLSAVTESVRNMFSGSIDFVKTSSDGSGNVTVNILAVRQEGVSSEGVDLTKLIEFVTWLENGGDSTVLEYGFSNSSLEEVFLKVTDSQGPVETLSTGMHPTGMHPPIAVNNSDEEVQAGGQAGHCIGVYEKHSEISLHQQVEALVLHHITRAWTGRRSIASWASFAILTFIVVMLGTAFSSHIAGVFPCTAISLIALTITLSIYNDRTDGLFYLMRSQGLMSVSYIASILLYATLVGVVSSVFITTTYYATNAFRTPELCDPDEWCYSDFGDRPVIQNPIIVQLDVDSTLESNSVSAFRSPSGYGPISIAALIFGLSFPGIVLASSGLPGNKLSLVFIAVLLLASGITPILHEIFANPSTDAYAIAIDACLRRIAPSRNCTTDAFSLANVTEDDLNCLGSQMGNLRSLCQPLAVGFLPQYGFYQMLSAALYWRISFASETAELVPLLIKRLTSAGLNCDASSCDFPFAQRYFWRMVGYEVLGVICLLLLGVGVSVVVSFPPELILRGKKIVMGCLLRPTNHDNNSDKSEPHSEKDLEEVQEERDNVATAVQDFIDFSSSGDDRRKKVPPVLMHKLRKVYPAIGRVPPKVALEVRNTVFFSAPVSLLDLS